MTTVVVFSSSLFIATAMVIIKAIELRRGKINFLLALFRKFDSHSDKFVAKMKFIALQLVQSARYIILIQIKETCKSLLEKVEKKIAEEYKIKQSTLLGQKKITNKGSVSFYLKKITEQKSSSGKGKIED